MYVPLFLQQQKLVILLGIISSWIGGWIGRWISLQLLGRVAIAWLWWVSRTVSWRRSIWCVAIYWVGSC